MRQPCPRPYNRRILACNPLMVPGLFQQELAEINNCLPEIRRLCDHEHHCAHQPRPLV